MNSDINQKLDKTGLALIRQNRVVWKLCSWSLIMSLDSISREQMKHQIVTVQYLIWKLGNNIELKTCDLIE